jgi:hypothetical protein
MKEKDFSIADATPPPSISRKRKQQDENSEEPAKAKREDEERPETFAPSEMNSDVETESDTDIEKEHMEKVERRTPDLSSLKQQFDVSSTTDQQVHPERATEPSKNISENTEKKHRKGQRKGTSASSKPQPKDGGGKRKKVQTSNDDQSGTTTIGIDSHKKQKTTKSQKLRPIPSTIPTKVEVQDGIEWITFTYDSKGTPQEYRIRTDIDNLHEDDIPEEFKMANAVYPKACCKQEDYKGYRWAYERSVNVFGWKLSYLNQGAMVGRKGLIQRAVDSFRNRFDELKSRRVVRQEKFVNGNLRKRKYNGKTMMAAEGEVFDGGVNGSTEEMASLTQAAAAEFDNGISNHVEEVAEQPTKTEDVESAFAVYPTADLSDTATTAPTSPISSLSVCPPNIIPLDPNAPLIQRHLVSRPILPKTITFEGISRGKLYKTRIRVDIGAVDMSYMKENFKVDNCIYPRALKAFEDYTASFPIIPIFDGVGCVGDGVEIGLKGLNGEEHTEKGEGEARRLVKLKERYDREVFLNELGWRLAMCNPKLVGRRAWLQKALDSYREKFWSLMNGSLVGEVGSGVEEKKEQKESTDKGEKKMEEKMAVKEGIVSSAFNVEVCTEATASESLVGQPRQIRKRMKMLLEAREFEIKCSANISSATTAISSSISK